MRRLPVVSILLAAASLYAQPSVSTGIPNLTFFLEQCPAGDPFYDRIRADFTLRRDGLPVGAVRCTEPVSAMPADKLSIELRVLQALRVAYHTDLGRSGHLSWTPLRLYDWMKTYIAGVNISPNPAIYCCEMFDGGKYIHLPDSTQTYATPVTILGQLSLLAHESRHAQPGDPGHNSCCGIPGGCDQAFNPIGGYGVAFEVMRLVRPGGALDIGNSCLSRQQYAEIAGSATNAMEVLAERVCTGRPSVPPAPPQPVGCSFPCILSLKPNWPADLFQPAMGGQGTVMVQAAPESCAWTAGTGAAWLTLISPPAITGSGPVQFGVSPNPGGLRSSLLRVGSSQAGVNQDGAAGACPLRLRESAVVSTVPSGARGTLTIDAAGPACNWSASSDSSWVQVFPLNGSGPGTLAYTVYPNYSAKSRSAVISIGDMRVAVNQPQAFTNEYERFVGQMYFNFFGRVPGGPEVAFQITEGLAKGTSRTDLVMNFLNSAEFNAGGRFTAGLYVGLLNRDAEYGGWLFQRNALATGEAAQLQLVANFIGSQEFQLKFGALGNPDFVKLLYRQVLLREPTDAEVRFQSSALEGGIARNVLASGFLNSREFQVGVGPRLSAFLAYATILLRGPSGTEFAARVAQINSGVPVRTVVDELLASAEFKTLLN